MRKLFILVFILLITQVCNASECRKYLKKAVQVVPKSEYIQEYNQLIGPWNVSYIAYGNGYLKRKHAKKKEITYTCILDNEKHPFWCNINE